MIGVVVISLSLLGISGLLVDSHRRAWRVVRESSTLPARDRRFARSMYRRRMLASGTIGLVGAAIAVGPLVPQLPLPMAAYLAAMLAACAWIMLLAMLDVLATRQHYRRLRSENRARQLQLTLEMQMTKDEFRMSNE